MSKSAIYTVNTSTQSVAVDGIINPGTVIRRFGPNLDLSGNALQISGAGYYDIDASFTLAPTAVGTVTITAFLNNVPIPGATVSGSTTIANNPINVSLSSLVRQSCPCCEGVSTLTFVLTGTEASITNSAIVVEKL